MLHAGLPLAPHSPSDFSTVFQTHKSPEVKKYANGENGLDRVLAFDKVRADVK